MQVLTRKDTDEWCRERAILLSDRDLLSYSDVELPAFKTGLLRTRGILGQAAAIVFTANEQDFEGGLAFVRSDSFQPETWDYFWGISEASLGLLRQMPQWKNNLESFPGQLFGPEDGSAALAYLAQLMFLAIDSFFVPSAGDYVAFVSHDEFISVQCKDRTLLDVISRSMA